MYVAKQLATWKYEKLAMYVYMYEHVSTIPSVKQFGNMLQLDLEQQNPSWWVQLATTVSLHTGSKITHI